MFTSKRQHNIIYASALIEAFGTVVEKADEDHKLVHFLSVSYYSGSKLASTEYEYFDPIDLANPPAILKEYLSFPSVSDNTRNCTVADITLGLSQSMPADFGTTMWS